MPEMSGKTNDIFLGGGRKKILGEVKKIPPYRILIYAPGKAVYKLNTQFIDL